MLLHGLQSSRDEPGDDFPGAVWQHVGGPGHIAAAIGPICHSQPRIVMRPWSALRRPYQFARRMIHADNLFAQDRSVGERNNPHCTLLFKLRIEDHPRRDASVDRANIRNGIPQRIGRSSYGNSFANSCQTGVPYGVSKCQIGGFAR